MYVLQVCRDFAGKQRLHAGGGGALWQGSQPSISRIQEQGSRVQGNEPRANGRVCTGMTHVVLSIRSDQEYIYRFTALCQIRFGLSLCCPIIIVTDPFAFLSWRLLQFCILCSHSWMRVNANLWVLAQEDCGKNYGFILSSRGEYGQARGPWRLDWWMLWVVYQQQLEKPRSSQISVRFWLPPTKCLPSIWWSTSSGMHFVCSKLDNVCIST